MRTPAVTIPLFSLAFVLPLSGLPAQTQSPPAPGWILVDDMWLPEAAIRGDSGYVPSYWPFGLVPYAFGANVSISNRTRTLEAMAELEAIAPVDFFPRTNQTDYVLIMSSTVNNSPIGVAGGAQILNIVSWGSKFTIVHELMHALGFVHEQCRPDRGAYVTINTANISTTACPGGNCGSPTSTTCVCNFDIINSVTAVGPYDFRSVMHYGRTAFSANGNDTITCNPGYTQFQNVIGNTAYLSLGDAQGLQTRYGGPVAPAAISVSPNSAVAGTSSNLTISVTGVRLCGGTTDPNGVPGTVIRWNGIDLVTTQNGPTGVQADVPAGYLGSPGTALITVFNAAPGGGLGSGVLTFTITCPAAAPIALAPAAPQIAAAACVPVSIPPVPLSNTDWHVIGLSSPSNWRLDMGVYASNNAGATCDFLAGDAYVSPGQSVNPVNGTVSRMSGLDDAIVEYATSQALTINAPFITWMPPGSIVRAFKFFIASGTRDLHVTGPATLRWWLVGPTATFSWRGPQNAVASGVVGGAAVTIPPGSWCLVVGRSGGASAAGENFTVNVCASSPPPFVLPTGSLQYLGGPCHPFQFTPQAGRWNVVGVSSPSDWDIGVGPAASEYGGNTCDYVVANGRQGAVAPNSGILTRYSGSFQGAAMFPVTVAAGFPGGTASASTYLMAVFEFEVTTPGYFDITIGGGPGYRWNLHLPGTGPEWRRRGTAAYGSYAADGTPATGLALGAGWHAAVVYRDGGAGLIAPLTFTSAVAPCPVPVLSSLTPASIGVLPAGAAPFTVVLHGAGFVPGLTQVSANGVMITPSSATATQLTVSVDPAAVVQATRPGAIALTVQNAPDCVSATKPLVVGSGSNRGTIRRHPPAPAPATAYAAVIEGGAANGLFTLAVDLGNPVTAPWPDPTLNMVLNIGTPGGVIPLVDGFGLFSPATGATLDALGGFVLPGFVLPNPPWGIEITVQGVYLDAAAPAGFNLTWARWPDRL